MKGYAIGAVLLAFVAFVLYAVATGVDWAGIVSTFAGKVSGSKDEKSKDSKADAKKRDRSKDAEDNEDNSTGATVGRGIGAFVSGGLSEVVIGSVQARNRDDDDDDDRRGGRRGGRDGGGRS